MPPVHFYCKELVIVAMAPLTMHSARTQVASKLMHGLLDTKLISSKLISSMAPGALFVTLWIPTYGVN